MQRYLNLAVSRIVLKKIPTFLQLHGEQVQPLHPLLQLVLGRRRHGVHVFVAPVIVLVRVRGEHLQAEAATLNQARVAVLGFASLSTD